MTHDDKTYREQQAAWRKQQEAELRKDNGWLALAGLSWLKEGENTVPALADAGVFLLRAGKVELRAADGSVRVLKPDTSGAPDRVTLGSRTFFILQRGKRTGIRLYDTESPTRKAFTGQLWYPVDSTYRIEATFHPYTPAKQLAITNVLGDTQPVPSPGYVTFTVGGKPCRLEAQGTPTGLFFNFRDLTSGKTTYPAGRFLETEKPEGGKVILDFNQAVNPPCAFTAFATCPLAPVANYLKVPIPAGEKLPHGHT